MAMIERVQLEGPRLFPEIEGLDDHILEDLAKVEAEYAIVICKINLPPGEVFRLVGEQYGAYMITTGPNNIRIVKGVRTEREDGRNGRTLALKVAKTVMSAFVLKEPVVVELNYQTTSSW